jgi:glycosyltransferase involved in cell wall biosynthesis
MNYQKSALHNSFFKNILDNAKPKNIKVNEKSKTNSNITSNLVYNQEKNGLYFWEYDSEPATWVSILIPSYNTKILYLVECMTSIKEQIGHFGIELVWIDDCSSDENTSQLVNLLYSMFHSLKHIKVVYHKNRINRGISFSLHQGVIACSNEIVIRMDSDDIMLNTRIQKQIEFMENNPSAVICGTNIICFYDVNGIKKEIDRTYHKEVLTWQEYKEKPTDWFLNHPTLCFRKTPILNAGNYRKNFKVAFEDLELELRVLKMFGSVHNLAEHLLLYRRHPNQITSNINDIQLNEHLKKLLILKMVEG